MNLYTILKSLVCWTPVISAKSSVGFHLPRSFVAFIECEWFLFFLLLRLEFDEPLGLEGRLLVLSICGIGTGAGMGLCKTGVVKTSSVPVDMDTVFERELAFGVVVGGCKLNVVSTNSSSNFRRLIVRDELKK